MSKAKLLFFIISRVNPGLGFGSFDYCFYKQMALAYDAQGNYVIVGVDTNFADMECIRGLPHCLMWNKNLCWYDGKNMNGFNPLTGGIIPVADPDFEVLRISFLMGVLCCIGATTLAVYDYVNANSCLPMIYDKYGTANVEQYGWTIRRTFRIPDIGRECTYVRRISDAICEAIVGELCFLLRWDRADPSPKMNLCDVECGDHRGTIYWENGQSHIDIPCKTQHFGNISVYFENNIKFIAVNNITGEYAFKPKRFTDDIIDVEMNSHSILVHTQTCKYVGALSYHYLDEFEGYLERQIPTKSARS